MGNLILKLKLLSDALIGSGEGWGANIDSDMVFDEFGLPYIPARRIKGNLRESALEVVEMFEKSEINAASSKDIDTLFGKPGQDRPAPISFSNLYLADYKSNREWMDWLIRQHPNNFSREIVLNTFSSIRQQTSISDEGTAKENSLRTLRVLKKDHVFFGNVTFDPIFDLIDNDQLSLLAFSALNLRHLGTSRNRGLGSVKCCLMDEKGPLDGEYLKYLENKINGV